MDLFIVDQTTYQADYQAGLNGLDSVIWIERYNKPCEFIITCSPNPYAELLPVGTFLSHAKTNSVMIVENRLIEKNSDGETKLKITGRSVDAYIMDHRVVTLSGGDEDTWDSWSLILSRSTDFMEYIDLFNTPWFMIVQMFDLCLGESAPDPEKLPNFFSAIHPDLIDYNSIDGFRRVYDQLPYLSTVVYDALQSADIGLKVERPGPNRVSYDFSGYSGEPDNTLVFGLYQGTNWYDDPEKTFDWNSDDIVDDRYFWSNRDDKNGAYIGMKGSTLRYQSPDETGWNTRMASVPAYDLDPDSTVWTSYSDAEWLALYARGAPAIFKTSANGLFIEAKIAGAAAARYGVDYHLGDLVQVIGNFGVNQILRVSECALISGPNGDSYIPTVTPPYARTAIIPES